jgi:hypothetical protein
VALVRTDASEERSATIIGVTNIGELGTMLAVTIYRRTLGRNSKHLVFLRSLRQLLVMAKVVPSSPIVTLMMQKLRYYETSVLTGTTLLNIPDDGIFHSHRPLNLILHTN